MRPFSSTRIRLAAHSGQDMAMQAQQAGDFGFSQSSLK